MGGGGGGNFFSNPIGGIMDPITGGIGKTIGNVGKNISGQQPNINLPGVEMPDYSADQQRIASLTGDVNNLYKNQIQGVRDTYGQQMTAEQGQIDKQMHDMITNLTTGKAGQDLESHFSQLGLLNSGAFNQGLADSFTPIQQKASNDILSQNQQQFGDIRNILGQQTGAEIGLGTAGAQRQFNLEDWYNNAVQNRNLAQAGANLQVQTGNQQAQNQMMSSLLGAGGQFAAK